MPLLRRLRPERPDVLLALGLAVLAQVEVWRYGVAGGGAAGAATLAATAACVAWRSRLPLAAAVVAMGTLALGAAVAGESVSVTGVVTTLVLFFTLGALADRRQAYAGLAFGVLVGIPMTQDGTLNTYLAAVLSSFVVPWLLGSLHLRRRRAAELAAERDRSAREAVAAERARLARELHDVASHHIGMVVVQAAAGDVLLERDPERARESLHAIEGAARDALVELRRMLGLLRAEDGDALTPQPSLDGLDALVERVRAAGVPVELRREGAPAPLPPAVDLAAYRVVQEGLTNVLKHAGPCEARVTVRFAPTAVELEVADTGRGGETAAPGFGLAGVRERVALLGGEVEARPRERGGYVLSARLPSGAVAA